MFGLQDNKCLHKTYADLYPIVCHKHLQDIFGLQLHAMRHELLEGTYFTGPFIKPVPGIVFTTNEVILPVQMFTDSTYRPNDFMTTKQPISIGNYKMNRNIDKYIRNHLQHKGEMNAYKRYMIETLRNWMEKDHPNTGPNEHQKFMFTKLIANVSSILTQCESTVRTLSHTDAYEKFKTMYHSHENPKSANLKALKDLPASLLVKYFILRCYHSVHTARFGQNDQILHDYVFPNCAWVENVGLVALETIAHPNYLVIDGVSDGNQNFYQLFVKMVERELDKRKVTINDALPTYYMENTFRGGTEKCY